MLVVVLLGLLQGLTEFVPVSSSGHLVLGGAVLGIPDRGLAVDVALHVGTLAAVVVVFRGELVGMLRSVTGQGGQPALRRLAGLLVVATLPIVVAGLLLRSTVEAVAASPRVAATLLFGTAVLLLAGEAWRRGRIRRARPTGDVGGDDGPEELWGGSTAPAQDPLSPPDPGDFTGLGLEQLSVGRALVVGFAQCLALGPGISRSGATIAAGMAAGMTRSAATRFSFLLAIPALGGAAVLTLPDLGGADSLPLGDVVAGTVAAFLAGYAAIRLLLAFVARAGLQIFAVYCAVVGTLGLALTS